ncbi:class I SAM-dependent methyltransferase [Candidatus Pelagibacter sp.]|jgi:SAM-dependent methyltransferase|nr:class I SAM-dependent methyltransferase [Candidatus Pelagibacter sp.]|tara:strand:+ start:31 stop:693 length:663 start_codon:yes stop_codon:yes gene_type:complete
MGKHIDIGYFKKPIKVRAQVAKERTVINKMHAWELGKEYYDGSRLNGYGGFKYDGRWLKLLPKLIKRYKLTSKSKVLDLGCKKGFLLKDLNILIPGIKSFGIENHPYALKKAVTCKSKLIRSDYTKLPFKNKSLDFVIAFNSLYMQNLGDVIKSLKEIERVSKKSYVVLASGENDEERNKFYKWTLIGTSILLKREWKTLFKKIKFTGDYYFSSAKSLGV